MARFKGKISKADWDLVTTLARQTRREQEQSRNGKQPARPPMICGYGRCSHESSVATHYGLDVQDQKIQAEIREMLQRPEYSRHQAGEIFMDEAVSAFKKRLICRKNGSRLNAMLQEGDVVVGTRVDRMFRSVKDLVLTTDDWIRRGVKVRFTDEPIDAETDMGWLFLQQLGIFAELYSRFVSRRNKEVCARMKQLGRLGNGRAPMGFKLTGRRGGKRKMVIDVEARQVMGEIVRVRDNYHWGWDRISEHIERMLSRKERREMVSAVDQGKRKWSRHRCEKAYRAELALRERAEAYRERKAAETASIVSIDNGEVDESAVNMLF